MENVKKLFMALCVVTMFFGIVGCLENSSNDPGTKQSFSTPIKTTNGSLTEDQPLVIPEPATMLILGTGLVGLSVIGKKRIKK